MISNTTAFIVLLILIFVVIYGAASCKLNCGKSDKNYKEGFYHNQTAYYPGCNPLLYTQCGGCGRGCGFEVPGCWRESDICGENKWCPMANFDKPGY